MIRAEPLRWSAWSPGRDDAEAWRRWCAAPQALELEGRPDGAFLPAMLRRRCGPLARAMLATAFECCDEAELSGAATVFASRHGNINESIGLLERLAEEQPLSPTRFSHTVHNAQAGLFSIAAANREASSSVAAREATFGCAWLEALTLLGRDPARPVLLVVGDAPLDPTFALQVDEPGGFYSLAVLLRPAASVGGLGFQVRRSGPQQAGAARAWPDALEFLRWLLSGEPRLELAAGRNTFTWERSASSPD